MSVKVCVQLNPHTRPHAHIQRIHPGVAILKRDWAGAVELVLRPRAGEDARCQDVRVVDVVSISHVNYKVLHMNTTKH